MSKNVRAALMAAVLVLSAISVPAQAEMRWLFKGGLDFGGESLGVIRFVDNTEETIRANEGFYIGGGLAYISYDYLLEAELTAAWKYVGVRATNGDAAFTRFPVEALVFYPIAWARVGGGLTYHVNPKFEASGDAAPQLVAVPRNFNGAVGGILQADYRASENLTLGVRYTLLTYSGDADRKSNGVGLIISGSF